MVMVPSTGERIDGARASEGSVLSRLDVNAKPSRRTDCQPGRVRNTFRTHFGVLRHDG